MRVATMIATAGLAAMLGAGAAQAATTLAAPMVPQMAPQTATVQTAVDVGPAPKLEFVRGGCGWGAHRTWHGYCHLNYGWRGRIRAHWGWYRWHRW